MTLDKFRDAYQEACKELPTPSMDVARIQDEVSHRRMLWKKRRYMIARGCTAAAVVLVCGAGTVAARNYRNSIIEVVDMGYTITSAQDTGLQEKNQCPQEYEPDTASFLKMGGVFPIEEDIPEEMCISQAESASEGGSRLRGMNVPREGNNLDGTGLLSEGSNLNGTGLLSEGGNLNGTGLLSEGSNLNGKNFLVEGSNLKVADLFEGQSHWKEMSMADAGDGSAVQAEEEYFVEYSMEENCREYDSIEAFREAEKLVAVIPDTELFDEEFTSENVQVLDDGWEIMVMLWNEKVRFFMTQMNNSEYESYSTGISYGGHCANKRSVQNSQGLEYVVFDSVDDEGQVISVHGVISVNGWDLSMTFEGFEWNIVEKILVTTDLSVYF